MRNKQRHGCLTAWLIYLMISSTLISYIFFFKNNDEIEKLQLDFSENFSILIGSIGILNILFCYLILKWVKLGFWGLIVTNFIMMIVHIMNGSNLMRPTLGLSCIIMLYFLLRLKKKNVTGWDNLE